MLKNKAGFTLIELVMIIVILGILAAVAIPRYVDMQAQARRAVVQGAYGGVGGQLQTSFANFRQYPIGTTFEASVISRINRDGWTYQMGATTANNAVFNIWSGTAAGVPASDPYVNAFYNAEFGSISSTTNN